jgi:hypothetical protein
MNIYKLADASLDNLAAKDTGALAGLLQAVTQGQALQVPAGLGMDYEQEDWANLVAEWRKAATRKNPTADDYAQAFKESQRLWLVLGGTFSSDLKTLCGGIPPF